MIPGTGCLLCAIKRFSKHAYVSGICRILKTWGFWGLAHVNGVVKRSMQKGIGNIKLANQPIVHKSNGKHHTDCDGFHHKTERFIVINPWALMKTFATRFILYLSTELSGLHLIR